MKTRLITGIVLALVFVPLFILGGISLNIMLLLLTLGASYELFKMFNREVELNKLHMLVEMVLAGGLYFILLFFTSVNDIVDWIILVILTLTIALGMIIVFSENFKVNKMLKLLIPIFYPAIGFSAIFALREFHLQDIGFLFMITIVTDIFAYIVGINFGKHRLAVKISPKKSVEGSIGGTFFAIVFTIIYVYLLKVDTIAGIELNILIIIGLVFVLSVIGQIGDLVASKLKRLYGIKDFSNLFPGHGGIMDRFDSAIYAAMVLILISKIVGIL